MTDTLTAIEKWWETCERNLDKHADLYIHRITPYLQREGISSVDTSLDFVRKMRETRVHAFNGNLRDLRGYLAFLNDMKRILELEKGGIQKAVETVQGITYDRVLDSRPGYIVAHQRNKDNMVKWIIKGNLRGKENDIQNQVGIMMTQDESEDLQKKAKTLHEMIAQGNPELFAPAMVDMCSYLQGQSLNGFQKQEIKDAITGYINTVCRAARDQWSYLFGRTYDFS